MAEALAPVELVAEAEALAPGIDGVLGVLRPIPLRFKFALQRCKQQRGFDTVRKLAADTRGPVHLRLPSVRLSVAGQQDQRVVIGTIGAHDNADEFLIIVKWNDEFYTIHRLHPVQID